MAIFVKLAFIFLVGFFIAVIVGPVMLYLLKKKKASQTILEYVDFHDTKQGTPTMGGIIFIVAFLICSLVFFNKGFVVAGVALLFAVAFALIGFLDDFIKIARKQNEGLSAFQKFSLQLIVAIFAGCYLYLHNLTHLILPFSGISINLSWGIVPFAVFVFVATTNAVNVTDGLDGLAGMISILYFVAITILIFMNQELTNLDSNELMNFSIISASIAGGLMGFLFFNGYPAKIFMGDTGSLALGGLVAIVSMFTENTIYILFFGIMFVISILSVAIQVLYYKLTKKRIFLMSPLHHHFEKKGIHEVKIVSIYSIITAVISIATLVIEYSVK